jgi:hypothetical protein
MVCFVTMRQGEEFEAPAAGGGRVEANEVRAGRSSHACPTGGETIGSKFEATHFEAI